MIQERALKIVLVVVGLLFLAGAYPLTQWNQPEIAPEQMLGSVYCKLRGLPEHCLPFRFGSCATAANCGQF